MKQILIIEDDKKLREELKIFLENNGYDVLVLENFEHILENPKTFTTDLILLDINLPYADGKFVCKQIRKVSEIPIVIITCRDNEIDELISLNYGADQYVTKPFNIQILLAKINRLLAREENGLRDEIKFMGATFYLSKSIVEKQGNKVELTKNEAKILHHLLQNIGKIVSRNDLMDTLWESESFVDDNTLTVNITRLRNKLEEIQLKDCIETKRGMGYILK